MLLRINKSSVGRFVEVTGANVEGETHRYYVTRTDDAKLVLVVCQNDLDLPSLAGFTVGVNIE